MIERESLISKIMSLITEEISLCKGQLLKYILDQENIRVDY